MRSNRTNIIARLKKESTKKTAPESDAIHLLKTAFEEDPSNESKCIESARSYIDRNIPNRLFNGFPCLITPKKLHQFSQQYTTIMRGIQKQDISDDLVITNQAILQRLMVWEKKIIDLGISQLLNKTGHIHDSLIETLKLQSQRHKIRTSDIVSSFIGLIHECITLHAKNTLKEKPIINAACHTYLNEHRQAWITEQLDEKDYVFVSHREAKKQTPPSHSNTPAMFGAVAVGVISFYMLFNRNTKNSETVTPEEAKPTAIRVNSQSS
jgi:hypothetical protein